MKVRKHCYFEGHVQGVGFRATAQSIATRHGVGGWVRNLPDRRVELVVEGEPDEVQDYLTALQDRMSGHIRQVITNDEPPRNESNFRIER